MTEEANVSAEAEAWEHAGGYEPREGMAVPLLVGAVIQFILSVSLVDSGPRHDTAYFLGGVTGSIVLPWLVLWFAFGKRRNPEGWWKIPLALWPVALVASLIGGSVQQRTAERDAMNSIASVGQRLLDNETADLNGIQPSGATGEVGEMERALFGFMRQLADDRRNYQRELEESGIGDVFSAAKLRRRADLPQARRTVTNAAAIVARFRALYASRMAQAPSLLDESNVSDETREDFLAGYRQSQSESNGAAERLWQLEADMIAGYSVALSVLERGHWQRQSGRLMFTSETDLEAFNTQQHQITLLARQESQLMDEQRVRSQANVDRMRRLAN